MQIQKNFSIGGVADDGAGGMGVWGERFLAHIPRPPTLPGCPMPNAPYPMPNTSASLRDATRSLLPRRGTLSTSAQCPIPLTREFAIALAQLAHIHLRFAWLVSAS
ncbi:hypothetical protein H6G98_03625 [Nostoc sp. FACHB-857]|nr:hypothetical protein [Nostoc sp. FACHB-857]